MRKFYLSLFILLVLFGCSSLSYEKLKAKMEKRKSDQEYLQKAKKKIENPKTKIAYVKLYIQTLGDLKNPEVNNYLKNILFEKYQSKPKIQNIVFNSIAKQQSKENIDFFFSQIINDTKYKHDSKTEITETFSNEYEIWKKYFLTSDDNQKTIMLNLIKKLDIWENIILLYISESKANRENLKFYFQDDPSKTSIELVECIKKKKLDRIQQISSFLDIIGERGLYDFSILFDKKLEIDKKLLIDVFTYYGDDCLIPLFSIYENIKELVDKNIAMEICETLNTQKSMKQLEIWLKTSKDSFETIDLINTISRIAVKFPDIFSLLMSSDDVSYDIFQTLDSFIEKDFDSVLKGYYQADNFGKMNFLKYIIENKNDRILSKIVLDIIDSSYYLRKFTLIELLDMNFYKPYLVPLIKSSLRAEKLDEFRLSIKIVKQNWNDYHEFVFENFDSLTTDNDRLRDILMLFQTTNIQAEKDFLYQKFQLSLDESPSIYADLANTIINNPNMDSNELNLRFNKEAFTDSTINEVAYSDTIINEFTKLFFYLKDKNIANLIVNYNIPQDIFLQCSTKQKLIIINIMEELEINQIAQYIINNYESMNILERKIFNSSIENLEWDLINFHIKKLLLLGDTEDAAIAERIVLFHFKDSKITEDFVELIAFNYLNHNDFVRAKSYIEQMSSDNENKLLFENRIKSNISDEQYLKKQNKSLDFMTQFNSEIRKSILDSLFVIKFITSQDSILSYDMNSFKRDQVELSKMLNILDKEFEGSFKIAKDTTSFQQENDFLMKIREFKYLDKLYCGNNVFSPSDSTSFLQIYLIINNVCSENKTLDLKKFELSNAKVSYKKSWKGDYFYYFNKKNFSDFIEIKSNKSLVIPILFEVNAASTEFILKYNSNSLIDVKMPLKFKTM